MNKSPFVVVVANRNFRNLWLGQIISQIAINMLIFILGIKVYQATHSNTAVSLMFMTFGLPAIFFGVVAGGIVDHFDKKDVLAFCNLVRVILFLSFFLLHTHLFALYILAVFFSLVTQMFIPAEAPSIPSLVSTKYLLTANSLFTISFYLSTVLGFILAGPALRAFGVPNVYFVMAAIMLIASFFVLRLPVIGKNRGDQLSATNIGKTIDEGIQFIRGNERISQSLILMTFAQALVMTLSVLTPGFADKVLAIDLTEASYLVMAPAAAGLILGAFLIGAYGNRFLKGTVILVGLLATGITLVLLSLLTRSTTPELILTLIPIRIVVNSLVFSCMLLFLLGFFNSFITVPANTILQQDSEGQMRGRVYGVLSSLTGGAAIIPVIFSGVLADVVGVGRTLSFIGVVVIAIGIYNILQRKKASNNIK